MIFMTEILKVEVRKKVRSLNSLLKLRVKEEMMLRKLGCDSNILNDGFEEALEDVSQEGNHDCQQSIEADEKIYLLREVFPVGLME